MSFRYRLCSDGTVGCILTCGEYEDIHGDEGALMTAAVNGCYYSIYCNKVESEIGGCEGYVVWKVVHLAVPSLA